MSPDEIDASYRADELLARASAAMDYLTTGHLIAETRLSSSGSVITTVREIWIAPEMTLMREESFGITVETLARADGLCFRQSGLDWMRRELPSPNPLSPQALLGEMLDGDYGELVRLSGLQDNNGQNLFRIRGVSATAAEAGQLSPSSDATTGEVPQAERTIEIVIERATFYPRSARIESRVTVQGTTFDETVSITFDRLGLPTRFPEDLPLSCSIYTS